MPSAFPGRRGGIGLICRDHRDEASPEVPGAFGLRELERAEVGEHAEDGRRRPGRPVDVDPGADREHAREVRRDAPAGDVAERVHGAGHLREQTQQARQRVQARGLEGSSPHVRPKSAASAP